MVIKRIHDERSVRISVLRPFEVLAIKALLTVTVEALAIDDRQAVGELVVDKQFRELVVDKPRI